MTLTIPFRLSWPPLMLLLGALSGGLLAVGSDYLMFAMVPLIVLPLADRSLGSGTSLQYYYDMLWGAAGWVVVFAIFISR